MISFNSHLRKFGLNDDERGTFGTLPDVGASCSHAVSTQALIVNNQPLLLLQIFTCDIQNKSMDTLNV